MSRLVRLGRTRTRDTIPEYSATGDVLAFRACGLQYRLYNRNRLPPSRPVQVWFGEFIHGVLEDALRLWQHQREPFPWDWQRKIRPIEIAVNRQLEALGLSASSTVFCRFEGPTPMQRGRCPDNLHPHKLLASQRAEAAINLVGRWLFPLMTEAEVRLRGTRRLSRTSFRAEAYSVTGVADVIASHRVLGEAGHNPIAQAIWDTCGHIPEGSEIIVDYKGMRRPAMDEPEWEAHRLQILTYAWLRNQQTGSPRVRACLLLYLNELVPSREDIRRLCEDIDRKGTDISPKGKDALLLRAGHTGRYPPALSEEFRLQRCIRVVPADDSTIGEALKYFDEVVQEIEARVEAETQGKLITEVWEPRFRLETCVACDFQAICPDSKVREHLRNGVRR
uniref:PD-(D/E)XK endonuclease-like domain-containing protein n=1 Tax=Thermomicrobium roseum TaxID=500 RepID=A0A7C2B3Q0_THERO